MFLRLFGFSHKMSVKNECFAYKKIENLLILITDFRYLFYFVFH